MCRTRIYEYVPLTYRAGAATVIDYFEANLAMNIEGLKRVLCDLQSESEYDDDDDNVVAPQEKRIKRSESDTTDSSNSAGRSILSFFNRDDHEAVAFSKTTDVETGRSVPSQPRKCSTKSSKSNEKRNARDYSKYRAVCLICAKNENPKFQKKAILSRVEIIKLKNTKAVVTPLFQLMKSNETLCPLIMLQYPKV